MTAWTMDEEIRELLSNFTKYKTLWIYRFGSSAGFSEWFASQLRAAWREVA